jgi:hypothetical protein
VAARILILTLLFSSIMARADDVIDRSGKWDVNGPLGPRSIEIRWRKPGIPTL